MTESYDIVVIGSGVAGALAAYKLSEDKKYSILILEAGYNKLADEAILSQLAGTVDNSLDIEMRKEFLAKQVTSNIPNALSPFYDENAPSSKKVASPYGDKDDRYYIQMTADGEPDIFKANYLRSFGGSTLVWRGNCPRMVPNDFLLKQTYSVADDWPSFETDAAGKKVSFYKEIEPWYIKAEKELGVSGSSEWDEKTYYGAFRSEKYPMPPIPQSYSDMLIKPKIEKDVLKLNGEPYQLHLLPTPQARVSKSKDSNDNDIDYYDNEGKQNKRPACQGNANCIPICPIQAKYDATVHLKLAVTNGVKIKTKAVVTRLTVDANGRVDKVYYKDWSTDRVEEKFIEVKKGVVLAAHAIESPKILLLSDLAKKSGQVGKNLMDHLNGEAVGLFSEPVYPFRGPQGTSSLPAFVDGPFRKDHAGFQITLGNDGWGRYEAPSKTLELLVKGSIIGKELKDAFKKKLWHQIRFSYSTEMLPKSYNQVTIGAEKDFMGIPRPQLKMKLDEYSRKAFVFAQFALQQILTKIGATIESPKIPNNLDYSTAGHIMGTCRMGSDASNSVVNDKGMCHEHPNLFIAGSSVFPTGGSANPTITLAALTLRTVEAIKQQLK